MIDAFQAKYRCGIAKLLKFSGMPSSSYYYRESAGKKGAKPSVASRHSVKGSVGENEVVEQIKSILEHEFIDCGYKIMTCYLQRKGYRINHKKTYRIMKNAGLLKASSRISRDAGVRKFVQFRKVRTERPFECIEMDIKMVWIPDQGKNAYLLSVIDVHTRKILIDYFAFTIKQEQVICLLSELFETYCFPENTVIRSDNRSQFIAYKVREYLGMIGVSQEFTHVATPEENAHIEAYHGILKRDVFDRIEYRNFGEIQQVLKRYVAFYNNVRVHGLLGKVTPDEKWEMDKHLIPFKSRTA